MTDGESLLENDLKWREAELASLKRLAIINIGNEITYRAILRASWAMLYAHFEGFTKFCWDLLLDHVQDKNISIQYLNEKFKVLALEKPLQKFRADLSVGSVLNFYEMELPTLLTTVAVFNEKFRPNPDSNLWPNVFTRECSRIGIDTEHLYEQHPRLKALVSRRNEIAHGKSMTIESLDEYSPYENAVLIVMHDLALNVLAILENESYLAEKYTPLNTDQRYTSSVPPQAV